MHYMDANYTYDKKVWRQIHKNTGSNIEQVLEAATVRPLTTHHKNYQN